MVDVMNRAGEHEIMHFIKLIHVEQRIYGECCFYSILWQYERATLPNKIYYN